MKGGLTGEDNVTWTKDGIAPVFGVNHTVLNNNNAKAKEAAGTDDSNIQKISLRQILCLLGVILVFLLSITGTVIMWGTNMIEDIVDQRLVLRNGSDTFQKWINPPVHSIRKFWLFNYTNVEAFELGKEPKLKVEEVGPYVFREKMTRVNAVFNDNGTVTYQARRLYEFLPERSGGSLDDMIVFTNIPLMTMHHQAYQLNYFQRLGASAGLKVVGAQPFFKKTAKDFFFGYRDTLITLAEFQVPDVKVGFLQEKNGTFPEKYTMYTGETDVNLMGIISRYNGMEYMDYYNDEECNRVDGSDGSKFPPSSIYPGSTIYVYDRDACRRIPFIYNESVTVWDGIPVLRYMPPDNAFDNGFDNPDNMCFCEDSCQLSGVSGISHCKRGAPLFVSLPHFYKADPLLLEAVEGLNPDPEKHQLYLDIHQRIGTPLAVKIRIQVNILVTNGLMQTINSKLEGEIIPIVWIEREMDTYPDDVKDIIYMITFTLPVVKTALSYIFPLLIVITGIVLLICAYIEIAALLRKDPPSRAASETVITRL